MEAVTVLLIILLPVVQDQVTLRIVLTILLPERLLPALMVMLIIKISLTHTVHQVIMVLLQPITLQILRLEQYPVQDLRPALRVNVHLDSTG